MAKQKYQDVIIVKLPGKLVENLDKTLQELDKHKKFINGANGYLFWSSCIRLERTLHKFLHVGKKSLYKARSDEERPGARVRYGGSYV